MSSFTLDISAALDTFVAGAIERRILSAFVAQSEGFQQYMKEALAVLEGDINSIVRSGKALCESELQSFEEWHEDNSGEVHELITGSFEMIGYIWFPSIFDGRSLEYYGAIVDVFADAISLNIHNHDEHLVH